MMRFQRLSPNILPLSNGRKSSLQTPCKDDESDQTPNYSNFDTATERSNRSPPDQVDSILHSSSPSESPNKSLSHHSEISGFSNGVDRLQWGHNKRSRGSRAENRSNLSALAGGNEQLRRPAVKVQKRSAAIVAAQKVAAVSEAMPPPSSMNCGSTSYTRGSSLRSPMTSRDCRAIEDRSSGQTRADKCPSQFPARKSHKSPSKADCVVNFESKQPSDQETGRCGTGAVAASTTAIDKINFDRCELPRIFLTLSRKEKEDDFLAMKGTKLPHRPKKRAKNIDKSLQYCFPGMWLADLTRSRYEVREKKCVKKRRRGLKGMESMDSDSE